jgi:VanZ family protein
MLTPFVILARLALPWVKLIYIGLAGIVVSITIEVVQLFIPGRVSDLADLASNSVSVGIGLGILSVFARFQSYLARKQSKN